MMTKVQLINNLKEYIVNQVNIISKTNPAIAFVKPFILRAVDNNINKVSNTLSLIADDKGNIDAEGIITEMYGSIMNTNPFKVNVPVLGDVEIGGNHIKLTIPFVNKDILLNTEDLEELKQTLLKK